ncbi:MAG: hypothetical protein K2R93_20180 [Gemmatimonadaceae bacterium]|nr:hypothetical protein [Gemmatimonadaceae bacterium]
MRTPLLLLLTLVAGCNASNNTDPIVCTTEARAGINVVVRDADTQAGLAAVARGAVTDGAYVDSLRANGSTTTMAAAYERPGTYVVDVRATGYQGFTTTGVTVTKDQCHVIPQTVTVALQKVKS